MQFLKRIGLLILTNLFIMIGVYVLLFVLERYFGIQLGGNYGTLLIYAAIIGFGGSLVSLWLSKSTAKSIYNIEIIDATTVHGYPPKVQSAYQIIQNIAAQKGIEMPEVGIYESPEPNAFATGPSKSNSLVAMSTGLLNNMNDEEISGVLGHEMTHILNGDMVTMTLLQGIMNTFVFFLARVLAGGGKSDSEGRSNYNPLIAIALEIVFGILGSLVVNQFSQYREYKADAGSAQILGKAPMIAALEKLRLIAEGVQVPHDQFATMKIFGGRSRMDVFATHPSLTKRIERLKYM